MNWLEKAAGAVLAVVMAGAALYRQREPQSTEGTKILGPQTNSMKTTKLVIVRHGESEWNKWNLFCGWHDAELSEEGAKDAVNIAATALHDSKLEFDIAYSSALQRAQQSLSIILKELHLSDLPKRADWHLNERHYGNLTGYNKRDVANKYGEDQVQIWRRKFDVLPPAITPDNPYYHCIRNNPSFKEIPPEEFPDVESLKTLMDRMIPFYEKEIFEKQVLEGKRVLIVAHGTVARALLKHIDKVSNENISSVNVPNSIPFVIEFDRETGEKVGQTTFLADENYLNEQIQKAASIGS